MPPSHVEYEQSPFKSQTQPQSKASLLPAAPTMQFLAWPPSGRPLCSTAGTLRVINDYFSHMRSCMLMPVCRAASCSSRYTFWPGCSSDTDTACQLCCGPALQPSAVELLPGAAGDAELLLLLLLLLVLVLLLLLLLTGPISRTVSAFCSRVLWRMPSAVSASTSICSTGQPHSRTQPASNARSRQEVLQQTKVG
jgi:hypothetical protein